MYVVAPTQKLLIVAPIYIYIYIYNLLHSFQTGNAIKCQTNAYHNAEAITSSRKIVYDHPIVIVDDLLLCKTSLDHILNWNCICT